MYKHYILAIPRESFQERRNKLIKSETTHPFQKIYSFLFKVTVIEYLNIS